ncbi:MAG: hypothetical protein AAB263_16420 [Planctomycetota bacterium]
MPTITIVLGVLLIILGVASRVLSDSPSWTVLIPAIIGALFLVLGLLALRQALRKHAMHAAALVALLAIGGSIGGLLKLPALLSGGEIERPLAVVARSLTCVLSFTFLVLAIRSFVVARLERKAQAGSANSS